VSLGRVGDVLRYPVKSLVGEHLERVLVEERGVAGDRLWSVRDPDGRLGSGKSSRRFRKMPGLLDLEARYDGDVPVIGFPDGRVLRGDDPTVHDALSEHVGRPVTLAREQDVSHFDEGPVHLVTTASLDRVRGSHGRAVDARHLRSNLVVETAEVGFVEEGWIGHRLMIGADLVLAVRGAMPRCVMVTMPQVGLPADPDLLGTLTEVNDACLGVVADVVAPGQVAVGDEVVLVDGPVDG
jgi:uncharacterized protein YcbX